MHVVCDIYCHRQMAVAMPQARFCWTSRSANRSISHGPWGGGRHLKYARRATRTWTSLRLNDDAMNNVMDTQVRPTGCSLPTVRPGSRRLCRSHVGGRVFAGSTQTPDFASYSRPQRPIAAALQRYVTAHVCAEPVRKVAVHGGVVAEEDRCSHGLQMHCRMR